MPGQAWRRRSSPHHAPHITRDARTSWALRRTNVRRAAPPSAGRVDLKRSRITRTPILVRGAPIAPVRRLRPQPRQTNGHRTAHLNPRSIYSAYFFGKWPVVAQIDGRRPVTAGVSREGPLLRRKRIEREMSRREDERRGVDAQRREAVDFRRAAELREGIAAAEEAANFRRHDWSRSLGRGRKQTGLVRSSRSATSFSTRPSQR